MARAQLAALVVVALLGLARAEPAPMSAWASGGYLSRASDSKEVPSAQALEEVFGLVAGLDDSAITVLEGLVDAQQMADERPTVVVVVASSADTTSPAVAAQLEALTGGSGSHLQLPNAVHEGGSHPVFAGLRRSAKHMTVKALGDCGPSLAGAGQASATTLRAELEAAAGRGQPTVVVLCPGAAADLAVTAHGGTVPGGEEAQLLAVAAQLLAELAPRHLLVHVPHAGTALAAGSQQAGMRRQLLGLHPKDAANRTGNYTICDPTCQKHVMWFQGLIVLVVILLALCVGCSCMHLIDVPTRFPQAGEASRTHKD
ncbi:hypothetical protein D9Q98_005336 [Chlorella vulgaris]|uniref:Uncharacterized protein n=1 Tax=Chlorella vulgaris TaxID=3077 RepID=A0A9D4TLS3_CHLVU|nr:hypothetical protein D9Q98_005336 [Chlorella vulgaris]